MEGVPWIFSIIILNDAFSCILDIFWLYIRDDSWVELVGSYIPLE